MASQSRDNDRLIACPAIVCPTSGVPDVTYKVQDI